MGRRLGAQQLDGGIVQGRPRAAGVEDGEQLGAEADDERLALGAAAVAGQGPDKAALGAGPGVGRPGRGKRDQGDDVLVVGVQAQAGGAPGQVRGGGGLLGQEGVDEHAAGPVQVRQVAPDGLDVRVGHRGGGGDVVVEGQRGQGQGGSPGAGVGAGFTRDGGGDDPLGDHEAVQHRRQRYQLPGPGGGPVTDGREHGGAGSRAGPGDLQEGVELFAGQRADLGPQPFIGHRAECRDLGDGGVRDLVRDGIGAGLETGQNVPSDLVHNDRVLARTRSCLRQHPKHYCPDGQGPGPGFCPGGHCRPGRRTARLAVPGRPGPRDRCGEAGDGVKTIHHVVDIDAGPPAVWTALTTRTGLEGWWSRQVSVEETGARPRVTFTFAGDFNPVMQVTDTEEPRRLVWQCAGGHANWQDNTFSFELASLNEGRTRLRFTQDYAVELSDDDYGIYNFNWGYYLESLRLLLTTGTGRPYEPIPA
jgi:uncharacterized protein YndB with AHSA1/START domain